MSVKVDRDFSIQMVTCLASALSCEKVINGSLVHDFCTFFMYIV